jgi:hypothetical protein
LGAGAAGAARSEEPLDSEELEDGCEEEHAARVMESSESKRAERKVVIR